MTGNTLISLSDFEDCNKTPVNDSSISEQCCSFHEVILDFDFNTNLNVKYFKIFNPSIIIKQVSTVLTVSVFTPDNFNFNTNLPPPSGYELLKLVQVFRL